MFLSIITRCCQRPRFLVDNIRSVKSQTCKDIEQVFVVDREKKGIQAADRALSENKHRMVGEYSFILDDDCWLIDKTFVEKLNAFIDKRVNPDIVMFKSRRPPGPPSGQRIFPTVEVWESRQPKHGTTNCLCYAVRTPIWKESIEYFGVKPWGGDWWFLSRLIDLGYNLSWLDVMGAESRQLGRGKLFEKAGKNWFEEIAIEEELTNLGNDDWRFRLWKSLDVGEYELVHVCEKCATREMLNHTVRVCNKEKCFLCGEEACFDLIVKKGKYGRG